MGRKLVLPFLILCIAGGLTAQSIEQQTITNAQNYLAIQDYERAYSFINFALKLNAGEENPEVRNLAESIYFNYLQDLLESRDFTTFDTVKLNLSTYPQVNSVRIQQLVTESEERIAFERQVQVEEEQSRRANEEAQRIADQEAQLRREELRQQQAINEQLIEIQRLELEQQSRRDEILLQDIESRASQAEIDRQEQQDFNQALLTVVAADNEDTGLSTLVIIVLAVVGVIVLLGFGMLGYMFVRNSNQQQRFFEYTVSQVSQPREVLSIPMYTAPVVDRSHQLTHQPDRKLLPSSEPDLESLKTLMAKCREVSAEIDEKTKRKNATRNVAELVYKIATYLGYDEYECMLFLGVGLVYDVGFLEMDDALFEQTKLTEEQFESLKQHTRLGENRIDFVDEQFKPMFLAGITKHHENLDGSGYPDGISGDEIPFIARAIHAAESFTAMTSEREFREIKNKTDAIAILMQETDKYDPEILNAITNVV